MATIDIIRAWKDEEYRLSLRPEQRARLAEHPAGLLALPEDVLDAVARGWVSATA
jgi:mersacidin/lichenicidin family type 2 lantibiotic